MQFDARPAILMVAKTEANVLETGSKADPSAQR
jgi:hypothetical protein